MRDMGRPACAAIPAAMDADAPRLSLGCTGMRTFTGIPADRVLAVLPGERLESFVAALERAAGVNVDMGEFHHDRLGGLDG